MEKFPLTSSGAADLVTALYALSDVALFAEADAAALDFGDWVREHFHLDVGQHAYLAEMNAHLIAFMGNQVAIAMRHRLSLSLVKPLSKGLRDTKLIETKSNIDATGDDGDELASGSVVIEISY